MHIFCNKCNFIYILGGGVISTLHYLPIKCSLVVLELDYIHSLIVVTCQQRILKEEQKKEISLF